MSDQPPLTDDELRKIRELLKREERQENLRLAELQKTVSIKQLERERKYGRRTVNLVAD